MFAHNIVSDLGQWDLHVEGDAIVGKSMSPSEIQDLANHGFAILPAAGDQAVEYSPNMTSVDVVQWVFDQLPRVREFVEQNDDRLASDRSPLVLLQKDNRQLRLFRHAHPNGHHIEICMRGGDQKSTKNGIYMGESRVTSSVVNSQPQQSRGPSRSRTSDRALCLHRRL